MSNYSYHIHKYIKVRKLQIRIRCKFSNKNWHIARPLNLFIYIIVKGKKHLEDDTTLVSSSNYA